MSGLLPHVDPEGLLEYSVVYTDRALNHMSQRFQQVMRDISSNLKDLYQAYSVVVIPGSGTFGMEAVARQFATDQDCLIIRNGWFSYRWSQIFSAGKIPASETVLKARAIENGPQAALAPAPIDEVVADIKANKPSLVIAAHVETAAGMILPDEYLKAVSQAVHQVGGLFVLDCIASGATWVDMKACGVDILLSAPQKGWSSSPCCGLVMMSERARARIDETQSTSFACDLKQWLQVMETYEQGGHAYYTTLPTDALAHFRDTINETGGLGFAEMKLRQQQLGERVRALLAARGIKSVAADGFAAPSVIVCYTQDADINNGRKFVDQGLQIASGVPLQCDEPEDFQTFRIGLFGLDKLQDVAGTLMRFEQALDRVIPA
ncbi:aminotransferase class V-fold PLP-dependent enzyme [Oceanisphaera pacifica]|uniref:Alanine--glyoxylate aminotransferase family protein n=1 Tax=Oceanisphaera pacifica TaxID=2818389 RepID=A0ABS3NHM3_9GAMM|nr:aminotransferase class V-fold PLP-dependent enzyme [Oceanisphaera pacifica]MBO1520091.1 alanine--glyoxylate aminotransferase family protein [Oceanisphaera pacifica]